MNVSKDFKQENVTSHKSKKRTPLLYKSLSLLLHSLQGEKVTVELKNDDEVTGIIETVGHGMDMRLLSNPITKNKSTSSDASSNPTSSNAYHELDLSELLIKGENILYVHIPPHIHMTSHINEYVRNEEYRQSRKRKIVDLPPKKKLEENNSATSQGCSASSSASSSSSTSIEKVEKVIYMPSRSMFEDDHCQYDQNDDESCSDKDNDDIAITAPSADTDQ